MKKETFHQHQTGFKKKKKKNLLVFSLAVLVQLFSVLLGLQVPRTQFPWAPAQAF